MIVPYLRTHTYLLHWCIGLVGRVFTTAPENQVSIPDRVIPKTEK